MKHIKNPMLKNSPLPVDIVLSPAWWYRHANIAFDEDFFFHPARRIEAERRMEQVLYERWGGFGLGADHDKDLPQVGAVHLAAGFLVSEMLGCNVKYNADTPPQVIPAEKQDLNIDAGGAFESKVFKRFVRMTESLKEKCGYLVGDVNFSGALNLALDLRGQAFFMDMLDKPDDAEHYLKNISRVIEKFCRGIEQQTHTSSISVNRVVRFFDRSVYLHSQCSHTMISTEDYEKLLAPIDRLWSMKHRPFGIHYCGSDPDRFAEAFSRLPCLDFLDVGFGGDVKKLRRALPRTFLNIRLSPVEIVDQNPDDIHKTIVRLVHDSDNPYLTGVCCINMDDTVSDDKITAIFETVAELRAQYEQA